MRMRQGAKPEDARRLGRGAVVARQEAQGRESHDGGATVPTQPQADVIIETAC